MTEPLWRVGNKSRQRKDRKLERKKRRAKFVVKYDLAYEGGGSRWSGYYRTYIGARVSAFWNVHFSSYGGTAELFRYQNR